ncbi:MAG TPA: hypothetical protein VNU66_12215 [Mycobacteriales bacterium]|nr:hypothetical protein [Mycobacteriales bacterium]
MLAERLRLPVRAPFAVGDVVLSRGAVRGREALLRHEARHAEQWSRWGGLPFLPAYGLAALWSWLRTGDRARGNPFEVAAGLEDGGY